MHCLHFYYYYVYLKIIIYLKMQKVKNKCLNMQEFLSKNRNVQQGFHKFTTNNPH